MDINLVEICKLKYPGQNELGTITFYQPENSLLIQNWNVPDIERPLEVDLLAEAAIYQPLYELNILKETGERTLTLLLDKTAQERGYTNALYCASYATSTIPKWKQEAEAFVAWRDTIYHIAIDFYNRVQAGTQVPDIDAFTNALPKIIWPN